MKTKAVRICILVSAVYLAGCSKSVQLGLQDPNTVNNLSTLVSGSSGSPNVNVVCDPFEAGLITGLNATIAPRM